VPRIGRRTGGEDITGVAADRPGRAAASAVSPGRPSRQPGSASRTRGS